MQLALTHRRATYVRKRTDRTLRRRAGWLLIGVHRHSRRVIMDLIIVLIILLLLFGGGGGLYWGMGAGWGIGPIGLLIAVLVIAYLAYGYRGRRN
jgi:hypothetical protein